MRTDIRAFFEGPRIPSYLTKENATVFNRRSAFALAAALLSGFAAIDPASAAAEVPYTQAAFSAAQQQGKPILVHVTASWCPVCAKQRPIVAKLLAEPAFGALQIFEVDFDTQKDLLRSMGVQKQSTFIVYHGASERARSTGETDEAAIRALLDKANG